RVGQLAFMLHQPGTLACRFIGRQRGEVMKNVVFQRDIQRTLDRHEVMHGDGQGAVHVEHPVARVLQYHFQSSRTRIRPSCATEATSSPARLKMLPRAKPRAPPLQGLSCTYRCQSSIFRLRWKDRKSTRLNSSHVKISYAVFCLKKKNTNK